MAYDKREKKRKYLKILWNHFELLKQTRDLEYSSKSHLLFEGLFVELGEE